MIPTKCALCENECGGADDYQCMLNKKYMTNAYDALKGFKTFDVDRNMGRTEIYARFKGGETHRILERYEYDDMCHAYKLVNGMEGVDVEKTCNGFVVRAKIEATGLKSWTMEEYWQHMKTFHGIVVDGNDDDVKVTN